MRSSTSTCCSLCGLLLAGCCCNHIGYNQRKLHIATLCQLSAILCLMKDPRTAEGVVCGNQQHRIGQHGTMTPLWTTACDLDLLTTCLTVYQDYKETLPPAATKCSACTFPSCLGKCSSQLPADAVNVPVYLSIILCML
jgi:hypothetical protein